MKDREVYCHYAREWLPMGRSRTRCPRCGADLSIGDHKLRDKPTQHKGRRLHHER